MKSQPWSMARS